MKSIFQSIVLILVLTVLCKAQAQVDVYEGFEADPLLNTGGVGWESDSYWEHLTGNGVVYNNASLKYPVNVKTASSGGSLILNGSNLISRKILNSYPLFKKEYYISFLVKKNKEGAFEFHGNQINNAYPENSRLGLKVSVTGKVTAKSSITWASDNKDSNENFSSNEGVLESDITNLVVLRIVSGQVIVGVYAEGDRISNNEWKLIQSSRVRGVTSAKLTTFVFKSTSGIIQIDEFRMASSLKELLE